MKHTTKIPVVILLILWAKMFVFGYSNDDWSSVESPHFIFTYTSETEHLVIQADSIAEGVAATLSTYFGYFLHEKVRIVLTDNLDYANGFADGRLPLVEIYCRVLPSEIRLQRDWLRTVITHELSHVYSIDVMKNPFIVGLDFGSHSDETNVDGAASTYFDSRQLPEWFVEGIAQAGSYAMRADYRDPFREMILRDALFYKRILSLDEMSRFEGTSMTYELAYNQGFSFVLYLTSIAPDRKLAPLCHRIRIVGFNAAIQEVYGKTIERLYRDWVDHLRETYPPDSARDDVAEMYPAATGPEVAEVAAVNDGRYVIANWRHDYRVYDLFVMSDDRQRVKRTIRETGTMLRADPSTGSVWYTADVYRYGPGVVNSDIYSIDKEGSVTRRTNGARTIAFDEKQGVLVFAAYDRGLTSIIGRRNGAEEILRTFPYDTAVYNISIVTPDTLLLTIDNGVRVRAAILASGTVQTLFPDIDTDILDATAAGPDTVVFVSTIRNRVELFWATRSNPQTWFRLAGNARFPQVEGTGEQARVTCSIYDNRQMRMVMLKNPFDRSDSLIISPTVAAPVAAENPPTFRRNNLRVADADILMDVPGVSASLLTQAMFKGRSDSLQVSTGINVSSGVLWFSAPRSFELGAQANLLFPFNQNEVVPVIWPDFQFYVNKHLGPFRFSTSLGWNFSYYGFSDSGFNVLYRTLGTTLDVGLEYQTSTHSAIAVGYNYFSDNEKMTVTHILSGQSFSDLANAYSMNTVGAQWFYSRGLDRYDPAGLGQPSFGLSLGGYELLNHYDDSMFAGSSYKYLLGDQASQRVDFQVFGRWLQRSDKASLRGTVNGFYFIGGETDNKVAPFTWGSIGSESSFSGFPYLYLNVRGLTRAAIEIKANPWVNVFKSARWVDRANIGVRFEAGSVGYFNTDSANGAIGAGKTGLYSTDVSFTQAFYAFFDRRGQFTFRCGIPLNSVDVGRITPHPRFFAGLSL